MRNRFSGRIALVILGGLAGALTMSFTRGQGPAPRPLPPDLPALDAKAPPVPSTIRPVSATAGPSAVPVAVQPGKSRPPVAFDRFRNLDALPELTRQMVMSAQTGMEWLYRYNQPHGQFLQGYLPAVNQLIEGDNYLHQAMATFALCRAARFTGDDRYLVRANQAILTLLSGTTVDKGVRRLAQQSLVCNRLGAAGYLVMAIHEMPEPAADLLVVAEELCAFIRQQQREDGSLSYLDFEDNLQSADRDGVNRYPGPALYAIALSQHSRPAVWKAELVRKAIGYYRSWFKEHPDPTFIPWMTAACVESYSLTKENACAGFAFEMNDWLCTLQYEQSPDPRKPLWRGGFKSVSHGRVEATMPGVESALYAQSLADCCRLLRQMTAPDIQRYDRYRSALIRNLHFLTTIQFTESNTLHIAANYRMMLVGGFHPTHLDGNLRVDQSAAGVSALVQFLTSGADRQQ